MLTPSQVVAIEERIRSLEGRTGVQVVAAAVERADRYHGLRWRAFALGSALGGGAAVAHQLLRPAWNPVPAALAPVTAVLCAGLALALAATLSPRFARLFLEPARAEAETRQCARTLFLEHELFATRSRTAVLLLACRFERALVALPDRGLRDRVGPGQWAAVESAAAPLLREGRIAEGLAAALDALGKLLEGAGVAFPAGGGNELPDRPIIGGRA